MINKQDIKVSIGEVSPATMTRTVFAGVAVSKVWAIADGLISPAGEVLWRTEAAQWVWDKLYGDIYRTLCDIRFALTLSDTVDFDVDCAREKIQELIDQTQPVKANEIHPEEEHGAIQSRHGS
jgi:hypothetical protein